MKDNLGTRMKNNYEIRSRSYLTRRTPIIVRLDGKAFHSFTKNMERPYSKELRDAMVSTALYLCRNIQGAKLAYTQSDEISILITDYDSFETEGWFDYQTQKICSVTASMATAIFNSVLEQNAYETKLAIFDARVFNIPKEEVSNYFLWRYKDWVRNSLQLLSQSLYSHKELHKKNHKDLHEMCFLKGHNWADLAPEWKNGTFVYYEDDALWAVKRTVQLPMHRQFIEDIVNKE